MYTHRRGGRGVVFRAVGIGAVGIVGGIVAGGLAPGLVHATHTSVDDSIAGGGAAKVGDPGDRVQDGRWLIGIHREVSDFDRPDTARLARGLKSSGAADYHGVDRMTSSTLEIAFGVTDRFSMGLSVPRVSRRGIHELHHHEDEHHADAAVHEDEAHAADAHHDAGEHADDAHHAAVHDDALAAVELTELGDSSGWGDATVYGQYQFFTSADQSMSLAFTLGIKLATGSTDEEAGGHRFEAELQPGSGSIDPLLGFAFSKQWQRWSVSGSGMYRNVQTGTQHTNLGDVLTYRSALHYRLSTDWKAGLTVVGEQRERLEILGMSEANSGGRWLTVAPTLQWNRGPWSASVYYGHPVVDRAYGVQDERGEKIGLGLRYTPGR